MGHDSCDRPCFTGSERASKVDGWDGLSLAQAHHCSQPAGRANQRQATQRSSTRQTVRQVPSCCCLPLGREMESASVCPLGICVSTGSTDPPTHCAPSGWASACSPFVTLISLYARQADERTSSGIRDADRSTAMHVAREAGMAQATRAAKKKTAPRLECIEHAGTRRRRDRPGARLEENGGEWARAARSAHDATARRRFAGFGRLGGEGGSDGVWGLDSAAQESKVYLAVASCRLDDALDALPLQHVGKKRNNASHSATWSKAPFRSISPRLPIASAASSKRPMRAIHPLFSFPFPSLHVTFLCVRGSSARHTRCGILPPLPPSPTTVTGPDDDSRACVWNSAD